MKADLPLRSQVPVMRASRPAHRRVPTALALLALLGGAPLLHAQGGSAGPDRYVGTWKGVLELPGANLRLALDVTRSGDALGGSLTSLDQNNSRIPVALMVRNDSLVADMPAIVASFSVALTPEGDTLRGAFLQNGGMGRLTLAHLSTLVVPVVALRPQVPVGPVPYAATDVSFTAPNRVFLSGTLTTPTGAGPFPAVVIVSGSGPQDRDGSIFGHRPFLILADYLTRRGIAVLRYDDRGTAHSTGTFAGSTTADFADDAQAAVRFLADRPEIDRMRVGIIGHSEGAIIAPMVAARSAEVGFIVLLAGPGLPGDSTLILQSRAQFRLSGAPDAEVEPLATLTAHLLHAVSTASDSAIARREVLAEEERYVLTQPSERRATLRTNLDMRNVQLLSPWMRYLLAYDPRPALMRVRVPVLALNGTLDSQVLYRENLDAIGAALKAGANPDFEVVELPGLNHLFQSATTGAVTEYSVIEETLSPAALARIGDWITQRFVRH